MINKRPHTKNTDYGNVRRKKTIHELENNNSIISGYGWAASMRSSVKDAEVAASEVAGSDVAEGEGAQSEASFSLDEDDVGSSITPNSPPYGGHSSILEMKVDTEEPDGKYKDPEEPLNQAIAEYIPGGAGRQNQFRRYLYDLEDKEGRRTMKERMEHLEKTMIERQEEVKAKLREDLSKLDD